MSKSKLSALCILFLSTTLCSMLRADENDHSLALILAPTRCETSLVLGGYTATTRGTKNPMSLEEIAAILGSSSIDFHQDTEVHAAEIHKLIYETDIFKFGLVAHHVHVELSQRHVYRVYEFGQTRLRLEKYSTLDKDTKLKISQNVMERMLHFLESFTETDATETHANDFRVSINDFNKMVGEWKSYRSYDPALYRLQLAILIVLEYRPDLFNKSYDAFSKWGVGYGTRTYKMRGIVDHGELRELTPMERIFEPKDSPSSKFGSTNLWEAEAISQLGRFHITSFNKSPGFIEYYLLRHMKSFHLDALKIFLESGKFTAPTQQLLEKEVAHLSAQFEAHREVTNRIEELNQKIDALKTKINDLKSDEEYFRADYDAKTKLKREIQKTKKSPFVIELSWLLGNLEASYFYPQPEHAEDVKNLFRKYRRHISGDEFIDFIDQFLPKVATKNFQVFENKEDGYQSHDLAKRRWSNWGAAWMLFFRSMSIFVALDPNQKRYAIDQVRAKIATSESISVEWAAEFDKKYLRMGDWGLGEEALPASHLPAPEKLFESFSAEISELKADLRNLKTQIQKLEKEKASLEADLDIAQKNKERIITTINQGNLP